MNADTPVARVGGPPRVLKVGCGLAALVLVALLPRIVTSQYVMHIAIISLSYVALSLSFDLVAGRIGALSLAHVAFFGTGAYASALTGVHLGWPAVPRLALAVAVVLVLAFLIGIPSFRLSYHAFAMGTLGFAYIMMLVIQNWVEFTRGPLCLYDIPPLIFKLGGWSWSPAELSDFYYIELGLALGTMAMVYQLARGRLGRTMVAIREDDTLASSTGIPTLRYKMFAFMLGAAVAGMAGAVYSAYTTVTCPSEFAFYYTVNLLVILFIGGRTSIAGITIAAIAFTALPEILRVAEEWRLVVYGVIVIASVVFFPDGLARLLRLISNRLWPPERVSILGTESRVGEHADKAPKA